MSYKIAGIDVHKKVLMVVVLDASTPECEPERRRFAAMPSDLRRLSSWLREKEVKEAVMESTAQYWRSVWLELEPYMRLQLAQAFPNRAPHGRKHDFKDAERLARRLIADELILSFVPNGEQRTWRTMTRMKTHRILQALARGESDPKKLAALGEERLQCSEEQLIDALTGSPQPMHRELLSLQLERLQLLDEQIAKLNGMIAEALKPHQETVMRLAEVPGFGVDSAQQVIAEVGVKASTFPSAAQFTSWVGTCPGKDESAEENHSSRSAKGNKYLRRVLSQAAHAAVKKNGSHFQAVFRRLLPRLGYQSAIWAIAHRLCRVLWKILHEGVRFIEQGSEPDPQAKKQRARILARALRKLGYNVAISPMNPPTAESVTPTQ